MKKTNLALAIFAAIAVAACGGSSSNDDAPVDKKPVTPAKPTTPTTGGNDASKTPEKTPEEAKPETPAVAGGGAGGAGAGGKTDGKKEDKKDRKPETAGGGSGGHSGGSGLPKDPDGAKKALEEASNAVQSKNTDIERLTDKTAFAEGELNKFNKDTNKGGKLEELEKKVKAGTALNDEEKETLAQLQDDKKYLEGERDKAQADQSAAEAELVSLKTKEFNAKINNAEAQGEPQSEVDVLKLELAIHEQTQEVAKLLGDKTAAEKAYSDLENKIKPEGKLGKALTEAQNAVSASDFKDKPQKERDELNQKLTKAQNAVNAANEELKDLAANKKSAIDAHTKADNKLTKLRDTDLPKANAANNFRGQSGTVAAAAKVQKIEPPEAGKDTWIITLDGKKPFAMDLTAGKGSADIGNSAEFGKFGYSYFGKAPAEGGEAPKADTPYAIKVNAGKTLGYGFAGDQFFHFGVLADAETVSGLNDDIEYTGTAFVKTRADKPEDVKDLVAKVEAKAHFKDQLKSLTGNFSVFQGYTITKDGEGKVTGVAIGNDEVELGLENKKASFTALIKGNSFTPFDTTDAKVTGNFYKNGTEEAEAIGGLVDHDKFYGSFGGEKKTTN